MKKTISVLLLFLLIISNVIAATTADLFDELSKDSNASADVVRSISSTLNDDINRGTLWNESALTYAIFYCDEDVVLAVLENSYIDVNLEDSYGITPLVAELSSDDDARVEVVKVLLEKGADPNSGSLWGYPPLVYAIIFCNEDVVMAMLENSTIDVNLENSYGTTPLQAELDRDEDARAGVVKALLKKGADTNSDAYLGCPQLIYAISNDCDEEVIYALIDSPLIDVNTSDEDGCTPLQAELDREEDARAGVVRALIEKGADPNSDAYLEYPPLIYAISNDCDEEVIYALMESPLIDINSTDEDGKTTLIAELEKDSRARIGVVDALIDGGINPNIGTSVGDTPAGYAIRYCAEEVALRVLASESIDVNLVNEDEESLLIIALSEDDDCSVKIIQALIKLNINPNIGDYCDSDILDYAESNCSKEVYDLVLQHVSTYDPDKEPEDIGFDTSICGIV